MTTIYTADHTLTIERERLGRRIHRPTGSVADTVTLFVAVDGGPVDEIEVLVLDHPETGLFGVLPDIRNEKDAPIRRALEGEAVRRFVVATSETW